ncbi:MAG: polysaccharide deacetylase family protein [Lachnospiraceae bacterium]
MEDSTTNKKKRVARVRLFKKILIILFLIALIIPTILCIVLFGKVNTLEQQLTKLYQVRAENTKQEQERMALEQVEQQKIANEQVTSGSLQTQQVQTESKQKEIYLTFDDGPSANTEEILDILAEYHVKATFFVIGKEDPSYQALYKRIVAEGHTLGMHSYSHNYQQIYADIESYKADLSKLQTFLTKTTGVVPKIVRFPGGSSNHVSKVPMKDLISYLQESGITYYDWNVACGDTNSGYVSTSHIVDHSLSAIEQFPHEVMILMHDANDKITTVEALPIIIEKIQQMKDTVLLPITEDTDPIQHVITR